MRDILAPLVGKRIRLTGRIVKITPIKRKKCNKRKSNHASVQYQVTLKDLNIDQVRDSSDVDHLNIFIPEQSVNEAFAKQLVTSYRDLLTCTAQVVRYRRNINSIGVVTYDYGVTGLKKMQIKKEEEEVKNT